MELSRDEIIFYRIFPWLRRITSWRAHIWQTTTRLPQKGDAAWLRFGWPRTVIIDCEGGSDHFALAAMRIDLNLVEAVLWNQENTRAGTQ